MKKLVSLTLALMLALSLALCAFAENGPAGDPPAPKTTGTLSLLNMTEDEYAAFIGARIQAGDQMIKEGYTVAQEGGPGTPPEGGPQGEPPEGKPEGEPPQGEPPEDMPLEGEPPKKKEDKVVYYDTLDALLMALNAGDIDSIEIFQSVARYLCATNDNLRMGVTYVTDKPLNTFAELVQGGVNGNDFAFLMMEVNTDLRDAFNAAIADMKADGTLDSLVETYIDGVIAGDEPEAIEIAKIDGAQTVRVAVTGSLPPMDYVAPDGTPAGFNTAVLSEIGNRTGMNIELVQVDSLGRAAALASNTVDVVFWTRTSSNAQEFAAKTEAEREAKKAEFDAGMTGEETTLMEETNERIDFAAYSTADMPEGTITTEPYFSDVFVPVELAVSGQQ